MSARCSGDTPLTNAITSRLAVPRRIVSILEGESLLNDATALTMYTIALAVAGGSVLSWAGAATTFAGALLGHPEDFVDFVHLTAAGHERVAALLTAGLIDDSPVRVVPVVLGVLVVGALIGSINGVGLPDRQFVLIDRGPPAPPRTA